MAGRVLGYCGAGAAYSYENGGRWQGLGWRRFQGYYSDPTLSKKYEAKMLSEEALRIEEYLKNIKARLTELKGKK